MEAAPGTKRCSRCKEVKPLTDFSPRAKGGTQGYCRPCHKKWQRAYYESHKQEYVARALKTRTELKAILKEAKSRPCVDCGIQYPPYVMDFDHREGEVKLYNVSALNHHRWVSGEQLQEEIAKCDLVCSNCHRERTHQRKEKKKVTSVATIG